MKAQYPIKVRVIPALGHAVGWGRATERELLHINGIGETKLERYGKAVMDAIEIFRVSHPDAETLGSCGSGSTSP